MHEHAVAAFRKSDICPLNKDVFPKEKILQGREVDEPVAESSIGNSYEAPRAHRCAAIEVSIKKSRNPSHLKVPFRHLATQHESVPEFRSGKARS